MKTWYLYVVRCSNKALYTGISTDVQKRVARHNAGTGAKYTASFRPVTLLVYRACQDYKDACKQERDFKSLKRREKLKSLRLDPTWIRVQRY